MDSFNGSPHSTSNGATDSITGGFRNEASGAADTLTARLKEAVSSPETITDMLKDLTTSISNGASNLANSLNGTSVPTSDVPTHPFDPLSAAEIEAAVAVVRREKCAIGELFHFNAVSLAEPKKAEMLAWLEQPESNPRPKRIADVVALGKGMVYDSLVDLDEEVEVENGINGHSNGDLNGESKEGEKKKLKGKVIKWEGVEGVQPLVRIYPSNRSKCSVENAKPGMEYTLSTDDTNIDHTRRLAGRRGRLPQRPQGHRAMRHPWNSSRRHAQSLL